jgi:plasmid stabilization system protein ParE
MPIWWFIAEDNRDAADWVELEIVATFRRLAKHPLMGTKRPDVTPLPVRFWTVTKFRPKPPHKTQQGAICTQRAPISA